MPRWGRICGNTVTPVTGVTFAANQGFSVLFDRTLTKNLQSPPPLVNGDWDVLTLQPDLALGSDGRYDALALRNNPSLANLFTVSLVWLGSGAPGAQTFIVYDTDFSTISQGQTTNVPEPATVALLLVSSAIAMCHRRRTRSGDLQSPTQTTHRAAITPLRGAHASRVSVAASRRDELSETSEPDETLAPIRALPEVRFGGTPKPTRETRVLPTPHSRRQECRRSL